MNKAKTLTPDTLYITAQKGTELPHTGNYNTFQGEGTYLCRQCGLALFRSNHKFLSSCGWPSFDDEIPNVIKRALDHDGRRTEILCSRCDAHLGHAFEGEYLTEKNLRHCVNSLSVDFANSNMVIDTEEAIFAGGCFWGTQYLFDKFPGVVKTEVGYSGGHLDYPNYEEVCGKKSGYLEVLRVVFDTAITDYEAIAKYFLEIHDATQTNGQGPDIGPQYLSAIFYFNDSQKQIAEKLIAILKSKQLDVVTTLRPATIFWPAEQYHQAYYQKTRHEPYCHVWRRLF